MMKQSAILTVLGMTVVFAFLWILVVCINLAGRLINQLGLDKDVPPQKQAGSAVQNNAPPSEIAAVITAAIIEHRKTKMSGIE
ncbi:MAG: OadG family protein [Spirochaetaceae bacterium]|jgi:oxaloacetate decarboxylase gamma subunit|nr:OadG family protein [Spirochaetaceae bacterium]